MKPITQLDVAKGLQFQLADLDLNHPHAREACLGLMSSLERSLDLIRRAEEDAEEAEWDRQHPLRFVAAEPFDFATMVRTVIEKRGA